MNKNTTLIFLLLLYIATLAACAPAAPTTTSNQSVDATDITKLNLNTVSGDQLLSTIPNFPNRMVREFQEYRPYVSIQQFRREIGKYVEGSQIAEYEKYVFVPISINNSDSATLQQIPGLGNTEAETLISARPYATQDDFLTKLSEYVSADELTIAKTYLGE